MTITVNGAVFSPGCVTDGHWGAINSLRVVISMADQILCSSMLTEYENEKAQFNALAGEQAYDELEHLIWMADDAEFKLNAVTEGGAWGWEDGEFFLRSAEELAELEDA